MSPSCAKDKNCTAKYGLGSVMDYAHVNLWSGGVDSDLSPAVLGEYDKLAIRYGYMSVTPTETVPCTNAPELEEVLQKAESMPVCFDEEWESGLDPLCQAYDLTSEPLTFYKDRMHVLASAQGLLLNNCVAEGQEYIRYGDLFDKLLLDVKHITHQLCDWVGGVEISHDHRKKGASGAAWNLISDVQTREALDLVLNVLSKNISSFLPPAESLPFLVHSLYDGGIEPVDLLHDVRNLQGGLLKMLLNSDRLQTLASLQEARRIMSINSSTALTSSTLLESLSNVLLGVPEADTISVDAANWDVSILFVKRLVQLYSEGSGFGSVLADILGLLDSINDAVKHGLHAIKHRKRDRGTRGFLLHLKRMMQNVFKESDD